jgi:site-specific DNA-methyltransferase (adenine-specific)
MGKLIFGDCVEVMASFAANSIDAIVCDPPYGISFMGKEFDTLGDGPAQQEFHARWAREAFRVLKPGGHVLAFGSPRTYHRMTSAIEDSGFEIRDSLMWLYGSGFGAKGKDIAREIDKLDRIGPMLDRAYKFTAWMRDNGITIKAMWPLLLPAVKNEATAKAVAQHYISDKQQPEVPTATMFDLLRPILPDVPEEIEELVRSRTIESENLKRRRVLGTKIVSENICFGSPTFGHEKKLKETEITEPYTPEAQEWAGWNTTLKPGVEPIVMARKPFPGTVAANVLKHGVGALNIDACRAGERWPSNVLHDGSEEVIAAFPISKSKGHTPKRRGKGGISTNGHAGQDAKEQTFDGGSAARFFYCAKVSAAERGNSKHPTMKPVALMAYLCRLVTPKGGTILDPFMGSGSTGVAAAAEGFEFIGIEKDPDYYQTAERRIRG